MSRCCLLANSVATATASRDWETHPDADGYTQTEGNVFSARKTNLRFQISVTEGLHPNET